jgi:hypothetical protein
MLARMINLSFGTVHALSELLVHGIVHGTRREYST